MEMKENVCSDNKMDCEKHAYHNDAVDVYDVIASENGGQSHKSQKKKRKVDDLVDRNSTLFGYSLLANHVVLIVTLVAAFVAVGLSIHCLSRGRQDTDR